MLDTDTMKPIKDLGEELQRQMLTKRDLIADTRRFTLNEPHIDSRFDSKTDPLIATVDLPSGAEDFTVLAHAHNQIGTHIGVDRKLYDKLLNRHPHLLSHLANGLLSEDPSKRMLRTMDGKVRAFLSNKYRPRDNWDLLGALLPVLEKHTGLVQIKACDLSETRMYVKIMLPEFEKPIRGSKVGDVVHGGVIVQNSEVGSGSLGIFPYTVVLRCTNGQTHTDFGQRSRHVGKRIESTEEAWEMYSDATLKLDDDAFFAKCQDTLRGVLNETVFDGIVAQMEDLAGIRVAGAPDAVVEVFAKKNGLTETERGSMLSALVEGSDLSGWGYLNAFTETVRDLEDVDRKADLERLAGKLIADPAWTALVAA